MTGISKDEVQRRFDAAMRLVNVVELDRLTGEARRLEVNRLAEQIAAETGCHVKTARGHIAKACRIKRHPKFEGEGGYLAQGAHPSDVIPGWGGVRPGAGRPSEERKNNESDVASSELLSNDGCALFDSIQED